MKKPAKNIKSGEAKVVLARQALRRKRNKTGGHGLLTANELDGLMLLIDRANDLKEARAQALKQKHKKTPPTRLS